MKGPYVGETPYSDRLPTVVATARGSRVKFQDHVACAILCSGEATTTLQAILALSNSRTML